MLKDSNSAKKFCEEIDKLLVDKLGNSFSIIKLSDGSYYIHDSCGHVFSIKVDAPIAEFAHKFH